MRQAHHELLQRVDLAQPLRQALRDITQHYALGRLRSSRMITQGYDDLNVLLVCEQGAYIAKLFNKTKRLTTIEDHVRVQLALTQCHAPVPHIITRAGNPLYRIEGHATDAYVSVSEFFVGENFVRHPPDDEDIHAITRFLATLHTLPLEVAPTYDSWGTLNLPREFARKRASVSEATASLVAPLADAVARLKFGRARRRVIHGDVQRKHVLKNGTGAYCVLDFGCADYSYPIVDLAVFLALFCLLDSEPAAARRVIADVLDDYLALAPLPARHIALLGTLVRATWASYLLTAESLMRQGDHSRQTRQWRHVALRNLRAFEGVL